MLSMLQEEVSEFSSLPSPGLVSPLALALQSLEEFYLFAFKSELKNDYGSAERRGLCAKGMQAST